MLVRCEAHGGAALLKESGGHWALSACLTGGVGLGTPQGPPLCQHHLLEEVDEDIL